MLQNAVVFYMLTCKCAWRHSGVPFFGNFSTSALEKWAEPLMFLTFWLANVLCANFLHPNFQKVLRAEVFCTFWLANVLLATAACHFWTCGLPKVLRDRQFFNILTCKCASRYSGVQFFLSALRSYLRTRRFSTRVDLLSTDFRAIVSSFFWLYFSSLLFIFWLCFSALLFQLSILSEVWLLNFLWS